jgi:hypothetical protein
MRHLRVDSKRRAADGCAPIIEHAKRQPRAADPCGPRRDGPLERDVRRSGAMTGARPEAGARTDDEEWKPRSRQAMCATGRCQAQVHC